MAESHKVLGHVYPAGTVWADLYVAPALTSAVASSFVVCNVTGSAISFRARVRKSGEGDDNKQYVYYDLDVPSLKTFIATIGWTLATGDEIEVRPASVGLAFTLFGVEIT